MKRDDQVIAASGSPSGLDQLDGGERSCSRAQGVAGMNEGEGVRRLLRKRSPFSMTAHMICACAAVWYFVILAGGYPKEGRHVPQRSGRRHRTGERLVGSSFQRSPARASDPRTRC